MPDGFFEFRSDLLSFFGYIGNWNKRVRRVLKAASPPIGAIALMEGMKNRP
jgi:hypothetical protein